MDCGQKSAGLVEVQSGRDLALMYICCSHTRVKHHLIPAKWGLGSYMPMWVRVWGFSARVHVLTCLQEPECFPSPELLQSKVFSASWEKTKGSPRVDTASSFQNMFWPGSAAYWFWIFGDLLEAVPQSSSVKSFPEHRSSSCPPPLPLFCAERMETCPGHQ